MVSIFQVRNVIQQWICFANAFEHRPVAWTLPVHLSIPLSLGSALLRLVVGASGAPGSVANPLKVPHLQITTLESRWLENCFYCDSRIGIYDHRGFVRLRLCLIVTPDVGHDEGVGGSAVDHLEAVVEQGVLAPPRQTRWRFAWNKKSSIILKLFCKCWSIGIWFNISFLVSLFT